MFSYFLLFHFHRKSSAYIDIKLLFFRFFDHFLIMDACVLCVLWERVWKRKEYPRIGKPNPLNSFNCPLFPCIHDHYSFWRTNASRLQNCWTGAIPIKNRETKFSRCLLRWQQNNIMQSTTLILRTKTRKKNIRQYFPFDQSYAK